MPILRAELEGLAAAGATFIQIDEPSPAIHPDAPADFSALFNAAVEPVVGQVRLGAHLCFGNYLGRPLARRTYRPVLDAMLGFRRRRARARVRQPRDGRGRRSSARSPPPVATSPPASSMSRTPTSRRRTRSPSGSMRCSGPASRPSDSRSSPTAASARPHAGRPAPSCGALVAGRDLVLGPRDQRQEDR